MGDNMDMPTKCINCEFVDWAKSDKTNIYCRVKNKYFENEDYCIATTNEKTKRWLGDIRGDSSIKVHQKTRK